MDLLYASYAGEMSGPIVRQLCGEMSGPIVRQLCGGDEWTYCMPVMRGR